MRPSRGNIHRVRELATIEIVQIGSTCIRVTESFMTCEMGSFKSVAIFVTASFLSISFSQGAENCLYGYRDFSAEKSACDARNQDRSLQERRYKQDQETMKEEQERKTRDDAWQRMKSREELEAQKRQKESEANSEYIEQSRRDQEKTEGDNKINQNKQIELLGELVIVNELMTKPYFKRSFDLANIGKCKESQSHSKKDQKMKKNERVV